MKKKLLVFSLFLVFSLVGNTAYGQSKKIMGKVTGESGPLPGASVAIKGTSKGTVTDIDGNYSLEVTSSDTLIFSFVGYKRARRKVGKKTVINIQLSLKMMEETVVVGYGSMKKSDLTGATTTVKVEDDVSRSYNSVDNLLMGRSSGVSVVSNSGNPGEAASVRIRGSNSLRGNNEPLYVVDGVVITSAGEGVAMGSADGNESQQAISGLAGINPSDIESIEVLKDASATAIYGSRGSNGVILITTKQGKKGEAKVDAFAIFGVANVSRKLEVLEGYEYAKYRNEAGKVLNAAKPNYYVDGSNEVYPLSYASDGTPIIGANPYQQVNWQDMVYQPGLSYNAGASVSGGTNKGNYYISSTFNKVGGIVENSQMLSGNLRMNLHQKVSKKFTIDTKVSVYTARNNFAQSGSKAGSSRSLTKSLVSFSPLVGDDVEDFQNDLDISNPLSWIHDFEDETKDFRSLGSMRLTYELPIKGLKIQVHGASDMLFRERRRWYGITTLPGKQNNGRLTISSMNRTSYTIDNLLLYNRTFKRKHSINATVGYVFDSKSREDKVYEVIDFITYQFTIDGAQYGQIATVPYSTLPSKEKMSSVLGRFNYSYNSRYSLTATFRADGSSKFVEGRRFGYFPSFSLAWRINEEDFMQGFKKLSNLKLRGGWGLTGNQAIKPYQTYAYYGVGYYANPDNSTGIVFHPSIIPNSNLKWETTSQFNLGIDYGFFKNRLYGSLDFYYKETYDLLQQIALPPSAGYKSMLINRGTVSNKGIDFSLTGVAISKKDLNLSIGGNFSLNRSKILDLGIADAPVYVDGELTTGSYYLGDNISTGQYFKSPANIFMVGQPIGMFYGWETNGIYQTGDKDMLAGSQAGDVRIVDQNGDGKITVDDRVIIGDPNPDFTYALNLDFEYKRLSVSILTYGVYGNDIANGNNLRYMYASGDAQNINPSAYNDAWRPNNPSNEHPRIGYSEEKFAAITDRIIEDGSYFRLQNVTIGYDIPVKNSLKKFRVYATGMNLFTITGYSGYEPNITSFQNNGNIQGVDWNAFPNTRTFMFGLNITF